MLLKTKLGPREQWNALELSQCVSKCDPWLDSNKRVSLTTNLGQHPGKEQLSDEEFAQ